MSFVKDIIKQRGARIQFLVIENEEGFSNFFYVLINEGEYEKLDNKMKAGQDITPTDHGVVLLQGEGREPVPEVDTVLKKMIEG